MCTAIFLWVSEVLPLYITSMFASFLLIVISDFSTKEVFHPYFDPVIMLFLGGFLLARALNKYRIDHFGAQLLLSRVGTKPSTFLLALMFFTAFLSLWISNTASAAIMIPLSILVLSENKLLNLPTKSSFGRSMILGVAYAATLGGIGSIVGSPPNAIAVKYLAEINIHISFLQWMYYTIPFVIICLLYTWRVLIFLNPPEISVIHFQKTEVNFSKDQYLVLSVFIITVLGWLTTTLTGISSSTIAMIPILLLFLFQLLDDKDLTSISWGTLLLFGGGLSLGNALTSIGAGQWLLSFVQIYLTDVHSFIMILGFIFAGILLTMAASNTAAAAILIPLILPMASSLGLSSHITAILIAIGVSLDFMIPVGTPPSAIAHSTGLVTVKEMIVNGVLINLGGAIILAVIYYLFY